MIKRKIQWNQSSSLLVNLPNQLCDVLGLKKGDTVSITLKENKIVIAPIQAGKPEMDAASIQRPAHDR